MLPTIAFDARWSGTYGIARYSTEIRKRLAAEVRDVTAGGDPLSPAGLAAWEAATLRARRRLPRETTLLSPSFTPSLSWRGPQAITVHDLIHLDVPAESAATKRLYYERVVRPAIRRNAVTFTVSEFSRERLVEWSGVSPDRIVVTGNAADERFRPDGPAHSPGYRYVLYMRNPKPHKNTPRLVEAFAEIADDTRLVLSGHPDEATQAAVQTTGQQDRVVFAGMIPDEELPAYYRGAAALAFPSLYEGFGIPAVEAMACGTPVVVSKTTSLPGVVGDAGILIDPEDPADIARGLQLALTDESTRRTSIKAGLTQAARFTWDALADTVSAALQR